MISFSHNHSKQQIYIMSLVLLKNVAVQKNYDTKSLNNQIDSLKTFAGPRSAIGRAPDSYM